MVWKGKYGNQCHIRAQSLILNKIISYDNSCIMRLEAEHIEMDLLRCYDCIIPYQEVIASQSHSMN